MGSNKEILNYITGYVNRKRYGIKTGQLSSDPLIYTYSENTGCGYDYQCSQLTPCEDDIFYKVCNLTLEEIEETAINYTKVKFTISAFKNGLEPYTTEWAYDTDIYDLIESTASSLTLNRKKEAEFNSEVSARVVDKNGCIAYGSYFIDFVPIPFEPSLNCSGILVTGDFVTGTASNGKIKVPYTIKGCGTIAIAVDTNSDGFSGSIAPFAVVPGTGSVEFPLAFNGSGDYGTATVPVKLTYDNSSSSCDVAIDIEDVPAPPSCSEPLNVTVVEGDDSDSDSDSDSDIVVPPTCEGVWLENDITWPHAESDRQYSQSLKFNGDLPFVISDIHKGSGMENMTITVSGDTVTLAGIPIGAGTKLFDFKLTNCNGVNYHFYSSQLIVDDFKYWINWEYNSVEFDASNYFIEVDGVTKVTVGPKRTDSGILKVLPHQMVKMTIKGSAFFSVCQNAARTVPPYIVEHNHCTTGADEVYEFEALRDINSQATVNNI